jgi:Fe2+ or Zn2+ uptake regulation protein
MARPSRYEPEVIEYLSEHPHGTTASDLVESIGCSVPHAYRTLKKLHHEGLVTVVSKTDTGATVYASTTVPHSDVHIDKMEMIVDANGSHYSVTMTTSNPEIANIIKELVSAA